MRAASSERSWLLLLRLRLLRLLRLLLLLLLLLHLLLLRRRRVPAAACQLRGRGCEDAAARAVRIR